VLGSRLAAGRGSPIPMRGATVDPNSITEIATLGWLPVPERITAGAMARRCLKAGVMR